MRVRRLPANPIIHPGTPGADERMGRNINGPSLIRVPDWLPDPLGRYYLYFAHHQGTYIRLAYADQLEGPWHIHPPGTLALAHTPFDGHIASPDVHVDAVNRRIVMYYHGCPRRPHAGVPWRQYTCVATSADGRLFRGAAEPLCPSYLRMFTWRGRHLGIAMPGEFYESRDGLSGFQPIADVRDDLCHPGRFGGEERKARHFAVQCEGDTLRLFYSRTGDCPEHILLSTLALAAEPAAWRATPPVSVLRPEHDWEGADCPLQPSVPGAAHERVHQLRDPAIYAEAGCTWLIYSVAGEAGLALAELEP